MPCHVLARRCRRFRGLRGDALFELADAVLCSDRPVRSLVQLSLEPEFRRGHGALYDALAAGRVDDERLFSLLAGVLPPLVDGPEARAWIAERDVTDRGMLDQALSGVPAADAARVRDACARWSRARIAVDATSYPRPDAWCSPGREHVHHGACHCRGSSKTTPGWEYQLAAVTGHLRTAWAAVVDVRRTIPATRTAQTIAQVKSVLRRLPASEAVPLFVFDAGYSAAALTDGLADCPAHVLVRLPAGSVFYQDAPSWPGKNGRPAHRGPEVHCLEPEALAADGEGLRQQGPEEAAAAGPRAGRDPCARRDLRAGRALGAARGRGRRPGLQFGGGLSHRADVRDQRAAVRGPSPRRGARHAGRLDGQHSPEDQAGDPGWLRRHARQVGRRDHLALRFEPAAAAFASEYLGVAR